MARDKATIDQILDSVLLRLRSEVEEFNESSCFLSDEPMPMVAPPDVLFCTVALTDSTFSDLFAGGGEATVEENGGVIVSVFRRSDLDQTDKAEAALLGSDRGLLTRFKRRVLRALCRPSDWEPEYAGNLLLRNQLYPTSATAPRTIENARGNKYMMMSVSFGVDFDWDFQA
jgi:hypothetical protein